MTNPDTTAYEDDRAERDRWQQRAETATTQRERDMAWENVTYYDRRLARWLAYTREHTDAPVPPA